MSGLVLSVYNAVSELPSGAANGTMAWIAGSTNRLYISNGTAWYSTTLTNPNAPVITSVTDASAGTTPFSLATDGTPTVITVTATDADGTSLAYSYTVTSGALGDTATISQADNVFTITPSTSEANAGTFGLTFIATDGVQDATSVAEFTLAFMGDWWGDRGVQLGSYVSPYTQIDYFSIPTTSSASNWGTYAGGGYATVSNSTRVVTNSQQYFSPATLGSASTASSGLGYPRSWTSGGTGDGNIGIFFGGTSYSTNQIETINIDTLAFSAGVASFSTFWNGTNYSHSYGGAGSNGTRAVYHVGHVTTSEIDRLEYVTIANITTGASFGTLTSKFAYVTGAEDMNYIVWSTTHDWTNSGNYTTRLEKVVTDTIGNATYFGDLSLARNGPAGTTNGTYSVFSGGQGTGATYYDRMDYHTIATGGSTTATGSLSWQTTERGASSGAPA